MVCVGGSRERSEVKGTGFLNKQNADWKLSSVQAWRGTLLQNETDVQSLEQLLRVAPNESSAP
jgi:hypothetical protein